MTKPHKEYESLWDHPYFRRERRWYRKQGAVLLFLGVINILSVPIVSDAGRWLAQMSWVGTGVVVGGSFLLVEFLRLTLLVSPAIFLFWAFKRDQQNGWICDVALCPSSHRELFLARMLPACLVPMAIGIASWLSRYLLVWLLSELRVLPGTSAYSCLYIGPPPTYWDRLFKDWQYYSPNTLATTVACPVMSGVGYLALRLIWAPPGRFQKILRAMLAVGAVVTAALVIGLIRPAYGWSGLSLEVLPNAELFTFAFLMAVCIVPFCYVALRFRRMYEDLA